MRPIHMARMDKVRPVLVMTRDRARGAMLRVTVIPITETAKGLTSEVPVGRDNGLENDCVASCDNITTIEKSLLGRHVGFLFPHQEQDLSAALHAAFDLEDL